MKRELCCRGEKCPDKDRCGRYEARMGDNAKAGAWLSTVPYNRKAKGCAWFQRLAVEK